VGRLNCQFRGAFRLIKAAAFRRIGAFYGKDPAAVNRRNGEFCGISFSGLNAAARAARTGLFNNLPLANPGTASAISMA